MIFKIADALRVPVLVLTVLALLVVLAELGSFAVELSRRRWRDFQRLETATEEAQRQLGERAHYVGAQERTQEITWSAPMGRTLSFPISQRAARTARLAARATAARASVNAMLKVLAFLY